MSKINLASEVVRRGADMKKPRMGSTLKYVPFGDFTEVPQIAAYHAKLQGKECKQDTRCNS